MYSRSTGPLPTEAQLVEQYKLAIVLNMIASVLTRSTHTKMHIIDRQCRI